jgi:hypothetical protein
MLPAGMPKRDYFEIPAFRAVIDEVARSCQVKTSDFRIARVFHPGANSRLFNQNIECRLQIQPDRAKCRQSVVLPPSCGSNNLALCTSLDANDQHQTQPYLRSLSDISWAEMPSC